MIFKKKIKKTFLYQDQRNKFEEELVIAMMDSEDGDDTAGAALLDLLVFMYEASGMGTVYELYEEEFPKMSSWVDMRNLAERAFSEAIQREKLLAIAAMKNNEK